MLASFRRSPNKSGRPVLEKSFENLLRFLVGREPNLEMTLTIFSCHKNMQYKCATQGTMP
jgi:hypothetical protein